LYTAWSNIYHLTGLINECVINAAFLVHAIKSYQICQTVVIIKISQAGCSPM